MSTKRDELLNVLLWTAERLTRPTLHNLTEFYEGWACRKGLLRQLQRLEQQKLITRTGSVHGDRLIRLTAAGRRRALGGRDPEVCWNRRWDGRWRLVLFDVGAAGD